MSATSQSLQGHVFEARAGHQTIAKRHLHQVERLVLEVVHEWDRLRNERRIAIRRVMDCLEQPHVGFVESQRFLVQG